MAQASPAIAFPTTAKEEWLHTRIFVYAALIVALALAFLLVHDSTWLGSAQLHTLMEGMASLRALFVGVMALVRFYSKKNNTFLLVGAGFLGTALLDGYHAIVASAFFADVWPSAPPSLIPWSWIGSRLFLSLLLFFSWWGWRREQRMGDAGRLGEGAVYLMVAAWTTASLVFFAMMPLPRAYYPEIVFQRPEEFIPAVFFGIALIGYLSKGHWKEDAFEHWLVISLIVGFMGQVLFVSYSGQLFDAGSDAAHALKNVSYTSVAVGLLVSMFHLFRQAEEGTEKLIRSKTELEEEIKERRRAEEELARSVNALALSNEALAASNRELGDFTYVVSHDLKEPLRGIEAFSAFLEEDYGGQLDGEGKRYINVVRESSVRMKQLIEDLLELSRLGRIGATYESVQMGALLQEVARDLQFSIEDRNVDLRIEPDMPTTTCDRTRMKQVFKNLISNAIKFSDKARPIVEVGCREGGDADTFFVRDNGIGIDEQYHDKVFQIFQRLNRQEEFEGTGAGLTICKKVVEAHGGQIRVDSREGEGSTFSVTIPHGLRRSAQDGENEDGP
ncbi:MAG: ATP-binding protein [Dehalococcoidia bacterium]